jgi:tetratricopeptide (TPR) repeat protein
MRIATARGDISRASKSLELIEAVNAEGGSGDVQEQLVLLLARAIFARASGEYDEALRVADEVTARGFANRLYFYAAEGWVEAVEAALALGDVGGARARIAELDSRPPVEVNRYLRAHRARVAARIDPCEAGEGFQRAASVFREIGTRYWLAVTLLEQAEWLNDADESAAAAPVLAEAVSIFEELGARPWLERARALDPGVSSVSRA